MDPRRRQAAPHPFRPAEIRLLPGAERWRVEAELVGLSGKGRLRLEWIIFYETVGGGNARKTARYFGISPQTFYHWYHRFAGRNIRALEDRSSLPTRKRTWQPDPLILERMLALRREYPEWGKETLAAVYTERYGEPMSSWQFQRMITHFHMSRRKRKLHAGRRDLTPKQRISYALRRKSKELWQLDTVVLKVDGKTRYVITALERRSKLGYAYAYGRHTSATATDFLLRLRFITGRPIAALLTDNGSEFAGSFAAACREAGVTRYYSRPRRPTDNPEIERFNQTLKREWLDDGNARTELAELNFSLNDWLETYNHVRPHHSLGLKTPLAVATETGVVSSTSPSATGSTKPPPKSCS